MPGYEEAIEQLKQNMIKEKEKKRKKKLLTNKNTMIKNGAIKQNII